MAARRQLAEKHMAKKAQIPPEQAEANVLKSGPFVRFTFIREMKQRAGLDEKQAIAAFERAIRAGRVVEVGRRGEVVIWEAKK